MILMELLNFFKINMGYFYMKTELFQLMHLQPLIINQKKLLIINGMMFGVGIQKVKIQENGGKLISKR